MYLIYIGLFWREGDILADLVADIAEESVVDEVLDYGMFIAWKRSENPIQAHGRIIAGIRF